METSIIKAKAEIERRISNLVQTAEEENDLKLNYPEHYGIIQGYRAALSVLESIQKETDETVSDDLNEAAIEYFKEALSTGNDSKLDAFRAGANWQKQKMMKDAMEGYITLTMIGTPSVAATIPENKYDFEDKIKLIIIKEDK